MEVFKLVATIKPQSKDLPVLYVMLCSRHGKYIVLDFNIIPLQLDVTSCSLMMLVYEKNI